MPPVSVLSELLQDLAILPMLKQMVERYTSNIGYCRGTIERSLF